MLVAEPAPSEPVHEVHVVHEHDPDCEHEHEHEYKHDDHDHDDEVPVMPGFEAVDGALVRPPTTGSTPTASASIISRPAVPEEVPVPVPKDSIHSSIPVAAGASVTSSVTVDRALSAPARAIHDTHYIYPEHGEHAEHDHAHGHGVPSIASTAVQTCS